MKVIEQFVAGKEGDGARCEDGFFVGDYLAAVVDGTTDKHGECYNGRAPGRIARDLLLDALQDLDRSADQVELNARSVVSRLDICLREWYAENALLEDMRNQPELRASASVVVYCAPRHELWMVGDCQARTHGEQYRNEKRIDTLLAELRSFVLEREIGSGASESTFRDIDPGREAIMPFLKQQKAFQNIDTEARFAYYVLDGFLPIERGLRVFSIPRTYSEIVLASDGYPELAMTLDDSEAALATVLQSDPLLYRIHPSTKGHYSGQASFDDRTFLRINIEA